MTIRFDRLQRLAHILDDLTHRQVELDGWHSQCGTTACALGWACLDQEFNKDGLSFSRTGSPYFDTGVEGDSDDDRHLYAFKAGAEFFGLAEGEELFGLRGFSKHDWDTELLSDRDLALHRIRRLFEDNGVPFDM